jgi:hypothetical protein
MKKILLFIFTIFSFSYFLGQGNNLQFNQVINQEFHANPLSNNYYWENVGSITVSSNKVLKISSASAYCGSNSTNYISIQHTSVGIKVNNHIIESGQFNTTLPHWLPAGTHSVSMYSQHATYRYCTGSISGVEFNIVQ